MGSGAGEGAPERALSPSSAADHLGHSHFKPDLQCPRPVLGSWFSKPEAERKACGTTTEGSGELPAAVEGLMLGPRGFTHITMFGGGPEA